MDIKGISFHRILEMKEDNLIYLVKTGYDLYYDEKQEWMIWKFNTKGFDSIYMKTIPYKNIYTTPYSYIDFFIKISENSEFLIENLYFLKPNEAAEKLFEQNLNIAFYLDIFEKYSFLYWEE